MTTNAPVAVPTFSQRCDAVQAFVLHHAQDSHTLTLPYCKVQLPAFITVDGLMVVLAAFILVLVFGVFYRKHNGVPTGITNLLEAFVVFIRDEISIRFLGEVDGRRMTPLFCSFFFFILTLNILGLVPSLGAATANMSVTGALAAITLGFMVFGAIVVKGPVRFLKGFAPHGIPWPVLIIFIPIEIVSVFVKAVALTIRLFANVLAGDMVLFFMIGMVVILGAWGLPFIAMAVLIYVLELGVAFMQAYIFTLLSAVFIGQRYNPEH